MVLLIDDYELDLLMRPASEYVFDVLDRKQGQKITNAGLTFEVVDFAPHNVMNFRRRQCELFRHCIDVVIKILNLGLLQHESLTVLADLHFQVSDAILAFVCANVYRHRPTGL